MLQIKKMRLPTCEEYDLLATTAKEDNDTMHWSYMLSWCQDVDPGSTSHRAVRGWVSARYWNNDNATYRYVDVGFRPVVEILNPDILGPDGATIMIGTLYMDDKPVKVPQNPVFNGDIPDYIPGAKLELREALDDPSYQVKAIKVGDVLVADRVLLKNLSWDDLMSSIAAKISERGQIFYFALTADNTSTNAGIVAAAVTKKGAFAAMYDRFAAIVSELFPNADIPTAEAAWEGWESRFEEPGYAVSITEDGYSIDYGGGDLSYCSIVEFELPLFGLYSDFSDGRTLDSSIRLFLGERSAKAAMEAEIKRTKCDTGVPGKRTANGAWFDDGTGILGLEVKPVKVYE